MDDNALTQNKQYSFVETFVAHFVCMSGDDCGSDGFAFFSESWYVVVRLITNTIMALGIALMILHRQIRELALDFKAPNSGSNSSHTWQR